MKFCPDYGIRRIFWYKSFDIVFPLFIVSTDRKKRSISNPLELIEDIKVFVSEANSLSWNQAFHNLKSNVGYGVQKVRRVSNHIQSNFR